MGYRHFGGGGGVYITKITRCKRDADLCEPSKRGSILDNVYIASHHV